MKTAELSLFIIEDDPYFRETLIDVMALRGVPVTAVGTAVEGMRVLRAQKAKPSVIILDVQLPDVDGLEVCRIIKRMDGLQNTPVVLLSAATNYSDPRDRAEGMLAGASVFLSKPITMEDLWTEIEALAQRR